MAARASAACARRPPAPSTGSTPRRRRKPAPCRPGAPQKRPGQSLPTPRAIADRCRHQHEKRDARLGELEEIGQPGPRRGDGAPGLRPRHGLHHHSSDCSPVTPASRRQGAGGRPPGVLQSAERDGHGRGRETPSAARRGQARGTRRAQGARRDMRGRENHVFRERTVEAPSAIWTADKRPSRRPGLARAGRPDSRGRLAVQRRGGHEQGADRGERSGSRREGSQRRDDPAERKREVGNRQARRSCAA